MLSNPKPPFSPTPFCSRLGSGLCGMAQLSITPAATAPELLIFRNTRNLNQCITCYLEVLHVVNPIAQINEKMHYSCAYPAHQSLTTQLAALPWALNRLNKIA